MLIQQAKADEEQNNTRTYKKSTFILCVMVCKIIRAQHQEITRLVFLLHVVANELDKRPKRSSIQTYQLVVFILEYYFTNLTQNFYN